jgi:hypothetical protein
VETIFTTERKRGREGKKREEYFKKYFWVYDL